VPAPSAVTNDVGKPLVLALWAGAGGLELKLQFRTALDDAAQQKPEKWERFNGSGLR
jgi:hypothetical protein